MKAHDISEVEIRLNHEGITPYEPRIFGWASLVVDGDLKMNDILLYKDDAGKVSLRFPKNRSRKGVDYTIVHPITRSFARQLEDAVLGRIRELAQAANPDPEVD